MSGGILVLDELGNFIKKRRLEIESDSPSGRMTQRELGERLGRAESTVNGWETGKANVPLHLIPDLANVLQVSPVKLLRLAGALKGVTLDKLLTWFEREALTDDEIDDAIELLQVAFKKKK